MPPKFQLYKDAAGKFRFRVVAENGQNIASSEAYEHYASAIKGINSVKKNARSEVEDLTINDRKVLNPKYQIYKDAADKFRFRLKASNGEIIAQSEGYETKEACKDGIEAVKRSFNGKIDESELAGKTEKPPVRAEAKKSAMPAKAKVVEAKAAAATVTIPEVEVPETKMPEVKAPEVAKPEAKIPGEEVTPPSIEQPEVKIPEAETPEIKAPEVKVPEAEKPQIEEPEVKVAEAETPKVEMPEIEKPQLETQAPTPQLEMPEAKPVLPKAEELREKLTVSPAEVEAARKAEMAESKPKGMSILKELLVSFVGLLIALIFSALALGIANWGIGFFGITGDVAKAAAVLAVAIIIGPTIAAFATKKYF